MTVLDTPAQINAWRFASAISQLGLEIKTGINFYGRGSVLKGIQAQGWTSVTGRATRLNKMLALAELLCIADDNGFGDGPVATLAKKTLAEACEKDGIKIVRADA